MNELEKQFYDLVISMIVNQKIKEERKIDEVVNQFRVLPMFKELSEEQILKIKAVITTERSITLEVGALIENKKHEKWFLNKKSELLMKYWDRYKKYLLQDNGFQPEVVDKMDDILDTLTDLLGNPDTDKEYQRRGLVIGDVQSGKTANYTGLICKAADAKYKVIVLFTGTIEKLRKQTQIRLDEGFIGLDSAAMIKQKSDVEIGVGNYDPSIHAMVLTSTTDDFKSQTARNLGFNLRTINEPVLFVVKKNVSVLNRLNKWLRTFNQNGENKIDTSILVIDDEADNASVNTNPEDRDPTSINSKIRELLDVFKRASYVGFTATPYANIFIDPETTEDMKNENLFPKDYIYALNAPTNYIGARDVFGEQGRYRSMCVEFTSEEEAELEKCLPLNHKSGFYLTDLPSSLYEAIAAFLIANVIRDLRNDRKKHRSMLINISRLNNVQQQVGVFVNSFLKKVQASARIYAELPFQEAKEDENILLLFNAFQKYYFDVEFDWDNIQSNLYKAIAPVTTIIVNQNSTSGLNYEEYSEGLRVIAIGGLSLSRGLTLEGLMSSFFYRNSRMYDTLMQMGRWFGYRKGYSDLCRIWMTSTSREWYKHISDATDELRKDIKKHEDTDLTPLDFGLRVRSDLNTLLVTARNKMRTASTALCVVSLSEECIETPDIYVESEKCNNNHEAIIRLVHGIYSTGKKFEYTGHVVISKNVSSSLIIDLLDEIDIPLTNETFDPEVLINFIEQYRGEELRCWDVVFANGSSSEIFTVDGEYKVNYKSIAFSAINGAIVRMSGSKRRVGTVNDGRYGLEESVYSKVKQRVIDAENGRMSVRQKDYFTKEYIGVERNPQLIIYPLILEEGTKRESLEDKKKLEKFYGRKLIAFGIGIPSLQDNETKCATYTINKIAQALQSEYDISEEE